MGVLLLHCTNQEIHDFSGRLSFNWFLGLLTHSFMLWPVDVFFMLSGFTLIRQHSGGGVRAFFSRRIKRLLLPVLFWNTVYMLISMRGCFMQGVYPDSLLLILDDFVSFKYNSFLWFFIPLTCIYTSLPFLSLFVLNADRKSLRLFIILSVALNILGCFSTIGSESHLYDIFIFGTRYIVFTVAGYYLGNYILSKNRRRWLYVAGLISAIVIFVGTVLLQMKMPSNYAFFLKYTNLPCTLTAFAVFVLFKHIEWNKFINSIRISQDSLQTLSSMSLGVYLIQMLGFMVVSKVRIVGDNLILRFVLMYCGCICIVFCMKKFPLLRKLV